MVRVPGHIVAQMAGSSIQARTIATPGSFNDDDLSSRSPFGIELPDLATMQRVPAVMNLYIW